MNAHASHNAVETAAAILRSGGLVAFPTETVYGLGASALDERAVARVFEVKERPRFDPLIVHVADLDGAVRLAAEFPAAAQKLAAAFWPGPLTVVLRKRPIVPDLVTAGGPTVALRVPDHPLAQELLRAVKLPIAAPSANPFGRISPTTAEHVREQLGGKIDLILDGGPCRVGVESTVLQLTGDQPILLRPGGTALEDIEALIGQVVVPATEQPHRAAEGLVSPGTLPQHYAPRTPLVLRTGESSSDGVGEIAQRGPVGLLAFRQRPAAAHFTQVEVLSSDGNLREAAANFFAALRRLDAARLDCIVAELVPETGLGRAINDRLRRAAHS